MESDKGRGERVQFTGDGKETEYRIGYLGRTHPYMDSIEVEVGAKNISSFNIRVDSHYLLICLKEAPKLGKMIFIEYKI